METSSFKKTFTLARIGISSTILKGLAKKGTKPVDIVNVLAMVTSMRAEPNKLDSSKTSLRFFGNFEVINLSTGEVCRTSEAFFPGVAEAFVRGNLEAGQGAAQGESKVAAMAFTINVEYDAAPNSAQGYKFGMNAVVNKEAADPFQGLRNLLPGVSKKSK